MQIHQILVRPSDNTVVVLYVDLVGRRNSVVFDSTANPTVASLVADCQRRLPPDDQNPAKAEVEQEITELEYRLQMLKQSIGQT